LAYFDAGVVEDVTADDIGSVVVLYAHNSSGISTSSPSLDAT
jgi:hypothetical protein